MTYINSASPRACRPQRRCLANPPLPLPWVNLRTCWPVCQPESTLKADALRRPLPPKGSRKTCGGPAPLPDGGWPPGGSGRRRAHLAGAVRAWPAAGRAGEAWLRRLLSMRRGGLGRGRLRCIADDGLQRADRDRGALRAAGNEGNRAQGHGASPATMGHPAYARRPKRQPCPGRWRCPVPGARCLQCSPANSPAPANRAD